MGVSTAVTDRSIGRTLPWRARTLGLVLLGWGAVFGAAYGIGSATQSTSRPAPAGSGALATGSAVPAAAATGSSTSSHSTAAVVGLSAIPATPGLKPKPAPKKPAVAHTAAVRAVTPVIHRSVYVAPRVVVTSTPTVTRTPTTTPTTTPTGSGTPTGTGSSTPTHTPTTSSPPPGTGTTSGGG
jgi:hypothetical protein